MPTPAAMRAQTSQTLWVATGGAVGAVTRELGILGLDLSPEAGVLLVNAIGSFVIGAILRFEKLLHPHVRDFHAVGFCGGLTTVSAWSWLMLGDLQVGALVSAAGFASVTIGVGLLAVLAGRALGGAVEAWWVQRRAGGGGAVR